MSVSFFRLPLLPFFLSILLALFVTPAAASEPLEAEKAFAMRARALDPTTVEVVFEIAPGYYLYGEQFRFEAEPPPVKLGPVEKPPGTRKTDPFFGEVETYRGRLRMRVPVEAAGERFTLAVRSQGCWDGGVCYPPTTQRAEIDFASRPSPGTDAGEGGGSLIGRALGKRPTASAPVPAPAEADAHDRSGDESGRIAGLLEAASMPLVLASFFGFGLLLAFTPCTFPMIPILSGIIVGAGPVSRARALSLSLAYVLGMAMTYAAAGVAAGLTGTLLAAVLQNTWVLSGFALLFVLLALSMFGLFELRLPTGLQSRLAASANRKGGAGLAGVAVMGALSALIVGPCVTAPLAGALLYIARTGDATLGGFALFVLALGMGVPLLAVALAAGALPRSGRWMGWTQKAGGVLLLAAALWVVWPVFTAASPAFERIGSEVELDARLQAADRPVLLDFYADWCRVCKEMERDTFSDPAVAARMARMVLLQVDVTAYDAAHKALLQRFGLVGPPGIVFFGADGRLREDLRVVGFMPPAEFAALLDRAL